MWSSSFSSESYVRIVLLICRLTVIQSGKSSHNLWKNPGESFTLMSFSASFCVFWPLSRKNGGRREERSQQSPCLPSAGRRPLGFAEVEVFEKLQVVRYWEFVKVCVFRPLHAWHERLSSHSPTVANQDSEFMGIFQQANEKHLPAQAFPQVPITTPRTVALHELASYKLGTVGPEEAWNMNSIIKMVQKSEQRRVTSWNANVPVWKNSRQ